MILRKSTLTQHLFGGTLIVFGGATCTAVLFFVLPLIQAITAQETDELLLMQVDAATLPPPVVSDAEQPEEEEQEEEQPPPELVDAPEDLTLEQLELALDPGLGEGWATADFTIDLRSIVKSDDDLDELFSLADLDQEPRVISQVQPVRTGKLRTREGTVHVIFIVDERGRVESPKVWKTTDPIFVSAALAALKKWKFEPGQRGGKPVKSRMRIPITFPKG
jgi:protein TonB